MQPVAALIAEALEEQGVRHVWGMPGGDTLPLVDAVEGRGLDFVLVRDEASAGFAADASAQLSGGIGACAATLGPGLTNLVSGVAGALLDRAPVLAMTSRYKTASHGSYTHMMLDQGGLMQATGKAVFRMTAANAAREVRRAIATARAPRPGPVWLEIPTEVGSAPTRGPALSPPPASTTRSALDPATRARIARWRRPAILVGFGGRNTPVQALAERLKAPVLTSYKAKGAIEEVDGGFWAGSASLSPVVDRIHQGHLAGCDGLLLIGWDPVELRDHWMPGWPDDVDVVVLDDHAPSDLPMRIDELATGDLDQLVADATMTGASTWTAGDVAAWRAGWERVFSDDGGGPASAVRAVQAGCHPDVVVSFDVGAHRIVGSNVWRATRPDHLLQSNGLASMGYALPAAMAAAAMGRPALALTGDMGIQLVMGELMTAAERGWSLTVVVFVDEELALIALKQKRSDLPSRGVRFRNPSWEDLGRAVGGRGVVARGTQAIQREVRESLARPGVDIIAVPVEPAYYLDQI